MNNLRQNIDIKNTLQTAVFITPQMKQSLAMLQMPIQELTQEISSILEENPVLEASEPGSDPEDEEDRGEEREGEEISQEESRTEALAEIVTGDDWEEYIGYEKGDDISYKPLNDDDNIDFEQFVGASESLYDHLMNQLKIRALTENQKRIGEYIIGNLGEDGYFRTDVEEATEELEVSKEDFLTVLDIVKTFDPTGVASGSLTECILAQMREGGCDEVYAEFAGQILENYSRELAAFKYDEILKGMGIERDTFDYILFLIKKTDPRPGLNFSESERQCVVPDVFIVPNGEKFDIVLNESGLPAVRLNGYYMKMLKTAPLDADSRQYIKEKIKNAVWVIESLQKRQKAIYKVVKAITEYQGDFLKEGAAKLKPLKLRDIAEVTELHESTVSRVTSGKYAMTSHGLIELKAFFAKSLDSDDGDMSTSVAKARIKELIESESPEEPLSDQRIVEIMETNGIRIARRTVAKYRDEMNIPTMSQRKRLRR